MRKQGRLGGGEERRSILFPPFVVLKTTRLVVPARKGVLLLIHLVQDVVSLWGDPALAGLGSVALIVHIDRMAHLVDEKLIVLHGPISFLPTNPSQIALA